MERAIVSLPPYERGLLPLADGAVQPYVRIGDGPIAVVVVPGIGDGFRTAFDIAPYLAWHYRREAAKYRLLILSRRQPIPPDYDVARHADDMLQTAESLGCGPAVWECVSGGGPIGQWAAVKRPDRVRGLILTSSPYQAAGRTRTALEGWLAMARELDGPETVWRMFAMKFTPPGESLPPEQDPLRDPAATPHYPDRLERMLLETLAVDHADLLPQITCPVLVAAGKKDRIVPASSQREMADLLPNAQFVLSTGFGHFHDMEDPEYRKQVERFIGGLGE